MSLHTCTKIILCGRTGVGKSSIANMLIQGNLFARNRLEVSDSATGVTSRLEAVDGRGWTVVDTVGLGETPGMGLNSTSEALASLYKVALEGENGFHFIAFVVPQGRHTTEENRRQFSLYQEMFRGAERNFILIITHCYDDTWVHNNRNEIEAMFGNIPIVTCDFEYIKNQPKKYETDRRKELAKLEKKLISILRRPAIPYTLSSRR